MTLSLSLNVQDLPRSLKAYQALGFRVEEAWQGDDGNTYYAELSLEGAEIGLAHIPSNDDGEFQKWVSTPLGAGVVAYLTVKDVDALHKKAKNAGFLIEQAATDRSYGRVLMLNDPDGYALAFMSKLKKAPATKKGSTKKVKAVKRTLDRGAKKSNKKR